MLAASGSTIRTMTMAYTHIMRTHGGYRVKRDLLQCQKRPTTVLLSGQWVDNDIPRHTHMRTHGGYSVKRDLLQCQKRPTTVLSSGKTRDTTKRLNRIQPCVHFAFSMHEIAHMNPINQLGSRLLPQAPNSGHIYKYTHTHTHTHTHTRYIYIYKVYIYTQGIYIYTRYIQGIYIYIRYIPTICRH